MGGAGYSAWSGIPYLISDYSPEVTYEGDNTVMAQQSANFLFKLMKQAKTGRVEIQGYFNYLNEIDSLTRLKCKAQDSSHFLNLENVHEALKVNLAVKVRHVS